MTVETNAILHIETSTNVCSVAVSENGQVIFHKEDMEGPNHARVLGGFVDEALSFTDSHAIPFKGVAVSSGPGSYTGLRIGVSMAKGLCVARDLKLISVPTLQLLCVPLLLGEKIQDEDALLCPMIDARRMEVYTAVYDRALHEVREVSPQIINESSFEDLLDTHNMYFFGNGSKKCESVIHHKNAHFIDGIVPLAKNMMPLSEKKLLNDETEDVAYYEPFYLKEFKAGIPKQLNRNQ